MFKQYEMRPAQNNWSIRGQRAASCSRFAPGDRHILFNTPSRVELFFASSSVQTTKLIYGGLQLAVAIFTNHGV
jgi:hypothetical protein